jgi:hypothetical protein
MDAPIGASFVGYWQSEKYFDEDAVRLAMAAPRGPIPDHVLSMGAEIASSPNPCFVGIRRGDNLSPRALSFHGLLPLEYHTVGMSMVRDRHPDVKFYIFSDDPEWCKQTFPDETVVEGNLAQPWWDIWLMSLCKNAVIPNSTFSWWGCWLGEVHENRTIICPKRWFVGHADARDICPERWIKL